MEMVRRVYGKSSSLHTSNTDHTYPVHFIDSSAIVSTSIITYTFRYDHVLDAQKLNDSLTELLSIGEWKKLGGRFRRDRNGRYTVHVPQKYTTDRPAVGFCHAKHDMAIDEHPLARRLPHKTDTPSVQPGCDVFKDLSMLPGVPRDIDHYLLSDTPMMSLFVNSFADATLVSLTFPHALTDAMGLADVMQAWSHVLNGRNDLITSVDGASSDILERVGKDVSDPRAAEAPFTLHMQQLTGIWFVLFLLNLVWDLLMEPRMVTRTIFLPAHWVETLKQSAQEAATREASTEAMPEKGSLVGFVSTNDALLGWGARKILSSRSWRWPATIYNVFDLRGRLDNVFKQNATYLQNFVLPSTTLLSAEDAEHASAEQIAGMVRRSVVEQTSDTQARRLLKLLRASIAATGVMPLFGSTNGTIIACTNWSKARFLEVADMGAALIGEGVVDGKPTRTALPTTYWGATVGKKDTPRDTFIVYGKDAEGNIWMHGFLRQRTWDLIESEFGQCK